MAKRDRNMERCRLAGGGERLVVSRALSGLEAEQPGRRLVTGKALSFIELHRISALGWMFIFGNIRGLSAQLNIRWQFSLCNMMARNIMPSTVLSSNVIKMNAEIQEK